VKREVGREVGPRLGCREADSSVTTSTRQTRSSIHRTSRRTRTVLRKSDLSPGRRWLVERMQQLGFGRITHLVIVRGEPMLRPPPRCYRHRRLTGPNDQRSEAGLDDFILKQQVVNLLVELDRLDCGTIATLEVRDGR